MKVLFIASDNSNTSGAFISMTKLIEILKNIYDVKCKVILPYNGTGVELLEQSNIEYEVIHSVSWICNLKNGKNLRNWVVYFIRIMLLPLNFIAIGKIAKQLQFYDLVHINTSYSYVGAVAAKKKGVPFVWHIREFLEEDQNKKIINRRIGYKLINSASRVIAISDSVYKKYSDIFDGEKLCCIFNGVDVDRFFCERKEILLNNTVIFMISGYIFKNKGQEDLIHACKRFKEKGYNNFELWIVGRGEEKYLQHLKKIIVEYDLERNVFLKGYHTDIENYYKQADVAFMCSKAEAFGRVTVEAMLSGALVVGASTAGTKELIKDRETGLLYNTTIESLVDVMVYLMENINEANKIAKNGQQHMLKNYTAEKNAYNIYQLYQEILAKR